MLALIMQKNMMIFLDNIDTQDNEKLACEQKEKCYKNAYERIH